MSLNPNQTSYLKRNFLIILSLGVILGFSIALLESNYNDFIMSCIVLLLISSLIYIYIVLKKVYAFLDNNTNRIIWREK